MNLKTAIQAKLAERRASEYLKRCKAATAAALAEVIATAEATGEAPQTVLNYHLGKTPTKGDARRAQGEAEKTLALLRQSKAPAKPAAPARTVYEQYRELKKSNPQAATKFFAQNKKQIFIEADATKARRK